MHKNEPLILDIVTKSKKNTIFWVFLLTNDSKCTILCMLANYEIIN